MNKNPQWFSRPNWLDEGQEPYQNDLSPKTESYAGNPNIARFLITAGVIGTGIAGLSYLIYTLGQ